MARRIASLLAIALITAAAAAVLLPGLDSWFVADDFVHLGYAKFFKSAGAFWTAPAFGTMIFRPLSLTTIFYEARLLGLTPEVIHLTDLVNHAMNAALVFVLVFLLFREKPKAAADPDKTDRPSPVLPALAAALIFAVHPVAALTATWFACRADLMATTFSLLTLIVVAGWKKPPPASLIAALVFALPALLCKVTHLPLFLAAAVVSLARNRDQAPREAVKRAALSALPVFIAALVYYCWRVLVLGTVGSYGAGPSSVSGIYYQAVYHLPRVFAAAGRDLLRHHLETDHVLFIPLAASAGALVLLGGVGAIRRQWPLLLAGLAFIAVTLTPAWNLSHMFAWREERLLYFPLIGFCLICAALAAGPGHRALRVAALFAVMFAAVFLGLYSRQSVLDWRAGARQNLVLANRIAEQVEPAGLAAGAERIYLLGLGPEHYYLDMMVKMVLSTQFYNREIITADQPGFLWLAKKHYQEPERPKGVPVTAMPKRTAHRTAPDMILQTVDPPDLLAAARFDHHEKTLEWNGVKLKDISSELIALYSRRRFFQSRDQELLSFLPSFSFRKSRIPLGWETSEGLETVEPNDFGAPYTFIANDNDPYLVSSRQSFPALAASRVEIDMKLPKRSCLAPGQENFCMMWESRNHPGYNKERMICFPVRSTGKIESYRVTLSSNIYWERAGEIVGIRLDPIAYQSSFQLIRLEFLVR